MKKATRKLITSKLNKKLDRLLATYRPKIIIVTGSVGKTSTKVAIGQMLSMQYKVGYSEDSYNFDISLPLSVFGLKVPGRLWDMIAWRKIFSKIDEMIADFPYEVVVLEVAEDERAKMEPIVERLCPDYAVVTEVSGTHLARMKSVEKVCEDSWTLASYADKIFYNADSELLRERAKRSRQAVGFGIDNGEICTQKIKRDKSGRIEGQIVIGKSAQRSNTKKGNSYMAKTQLIARHGLYSWLSAVAIARELELSNQQIESALKNARPQIGRMNLLAGVKGSQIIDDSYNSSPKPVEAALQTLSEIGADTRKIAVLGSMNELGEVSASEHASIGRLAAKSVDLLVTIGVEAGKYMASGAIEAGLEQSKIKKFRTPYEAGHYIKKIVDSDDVILIKGSQDGVYTEEVARILLDKNLDPQVCLVRQTPFWKRKKKRSFAL